MNSSSSPASAAREGSVPKEGGKKVREEGEAGVTSDESDDEADTSSRDNRKIVANDDGDDEAPTSAGNATRKVEIASDSQLADIPMPQ